MTGILTVSCLKKSLSLVKYEKKQLHMTQRITAGRTEENVHYAHYRMMVKFILFFEKCLHYDLMIFLF